MAGKGKENSLQPHIPRFPDSSVEDQLMSPVDTVKISHRQNTAPRWIIGSIKIAENIQLASPYPKISTCFLVSQG
jgi:hypothetical protein